MQFNLDMYVNVYRRGREYEVGPLVSSQEVADLLAEGRDRVACLPIALIGVDNEEV
jgi:hypothetical protein